MHLPATRKLFVFTFLCALLLSLAAPAHSQTLTTGDVAGVISDGTGAVVPNATVTLKYADTNETRTALTNSAGQYRFSLLTPGSYSISAVTAGLKSGIAKLDVAVGQAQELNLTMTVQGTQEVIEVRGESAAIQTENANLAASISSKQVVELPMNGGDVTTVAFTVPGVRMNVGGGNGNLNANGIPLTSVLFTMNGADVMDPYNNLNNSGASNNLLGANEVAEAAVILNAYSPQYGRMAGAQVNVVGKSGTNGFHGNAVWNYNDAIMNANSFFLNSAGTARGRSVSNLFGGSVGGPVRKNKTFFFVDMEGLHYALPGGSVVSIPSVALENYALAHAAPSAVPIYQAAIKLWNGAPGLDRAVDVTNGSGTLQDRNNHLGCGTHTFSGHGERRREFPGQSLRQRVERSALRHRCALRARLRDHDLQREHGEPFHRQGRPQHQRQAKGHGPLPVRLGPPGDQHECHISPVRFQEQSTPARRTAQLQLRDHAAAGEQLHRPIELVLRDLRGAGFRGHAIRDSGALESGRRRRERRRLRQTWAPESPPGATWASCS